MKKHLKFLLFASLMFSFSFSTKAQNVADYPDNAAAPGLQNVRVGFQTGNALGLGDDRNTFTGAFAGAGINNHEGNSYFGYEAGLDHNGTRNTFLGTRAGVGGTSEASVHIGSASGSGTFGSTNVFIGFRAGAGRGNENNQLYINAGAGTPLIYGDFADRNAGINTEVPLSTFDVRGASLLVTDETTTAVNFANSRATGLGQAGGPGGSSCNLYGFRSQTDLTNSVNVGMDGNVPTVLWQSSTDDLTFAYRDTGFFPCSSTRILRLGDGVAGSIYELIFDGDGRVNGSWTVVSDRRLKKDVKSIGNAMDLISQLNGVTYAYDKASNPDMHLPDGRVYGFIAQEVQSVIPEVTTTSSEDGLVGVKYTEIIPVLTEGIKEQQAVIEAQEERIIEQQSQIERLEQRLSDMEKSMGTSRQKESANAPAAFNNVKLSQNRPNPFSDVTTIDYEIPMDATNASLDIFSMDGQLLRSYNIEGGLGTVEIRSDALQSGTYVYAININGTNMATNIMIIQK